MTWIEYRVYLSSYSSVLCSSNFARSLCIPPAGGSTFFPFWRSKNSTTSGQFSRKCFSSPFCRQLEMLRDRLTAEAGGLGRRLFDQSRVSSEISFTPPLPPHFSPFPLVHTPSSPFTSLPFFLYQSHSSHFLSFFSFLFLYRKLLALCPCACWHPRAPEQKVAVLHSRDKWQRREWRRRRASAGERGAEDKDSAWTTRLCTDDMGNK